MKCYGQPPGQAEKNSTFPFRQVLLQSLKPTRGTERPAALMRHRDWPGSKPQTCGPGAAAEIEIVKVEIERRVEPQTMRVQDGSPGRQKDAVEQLTFSGGFAKHRNCAERLGAVRHRATEKLLVVPDEPAFGVPADERPRRLPRHATPVSGDPDHIEGTESIDHAVGQKIVVEPDIVMDKEQVFRSRPCVEALVEDFRQSPLVGERNGRNQPFVPGQSFQRQAQRRTAPEIAFRQAGGADDLDPGRVSPKKAPLRPKKGIKTGSKPLPPATNSYPFRSIVARQASRFSVGSRRKPERVKR